MLYSAIYGDGAKSHFQYITDYFSNTINNAPHLVVSNEIFLTFELICSFFRNTKSSIFWKLRKLTEKGQNQVHFNRLHLSRYGIWHVSKNIAFIFVPIYLDIFSVYLPYLECALFGGVICIIVGAWTWRPNEISVGSRTIKVISPRRHARHSGRNWQCSEEEQSNLFRRKIGRVESRFAQCGRTIFGHFSALLL